MQEHSLREAALLQAQEPAAAVRKVPVRSLQPVVVRRRCCSTSWVAAPRQPAMGSMTQCSSLAARPRRALLVGTLSAGAGAEPDEAVVVEAVVCETVAGAAEAVFAPVVLAAAP